jgi:hypothetical protein
MSDPNNNNEKKNKYAPPARRLSSSQSRSSRRPSTSPPPPPLTPLAPLFRPPHPPSGLAASIHAPPHETPSTPATTVHQPLPLRPKPRNPAASAFQTGLAASIHAPPSEEAAGSVYRQDSSGGSRGRGPVSPVSPAAAAAAAVPVVEPPHRRAARLRREAAAAARGGFAQRESAPLSSAPQMSVTTPQNLEGNGPAQGQTPAAKKTVVELEKLVGTPAPEIADVVEPPHRRAARLRRAAAAARSECAQRESAPLSSAPRMSVAIPQDLEGDGPAPAQTVEGQTPASKQTAVEFGKIVGTPAPEIADLAELPHRRAARLRRAAAAAAARGGSASRMSVMNLQVPERKDPAP